MISKKPSDLTRLILKTRHFRCNPSARTEIHSLVSHPHLFMYIAAVKSILRFYRNMAIISHDDGTLTTRDAALLKEHMPGIRIIKKQYADKEIAASIKNFPHLKKYRARNIIAMQLLDYAFFANTSKYISLDSDTLFIRRPDQLIEWVKNNKKEVLFFYEMNPAGQSDFLSDLKCDFPPHICAGFFCGRKEIAINFERIEAILSKMKGFGWFATQNTLPLLIKDRAIEYKISFFNVRKYQDPRRFQNGAVFRHYWASLGITDNYLHDFMEVVLSMKKIKAQE